MKEATGELSMTAIAVVAIVAIGALFTVFVYPSLKASLKNKTYCSTAFNCGECSGGSMKCSYYDEDGNAKTAENDKISCSCDSDDS